MTKAWNFYQFQAFFFAKNLTSLRFFRNLIQEDILRENNMAIVNATSEIFEREVFNTNGTVLVDFWAAWCGPCQMLSPILHEIAEEHPEVKIVKVNVDENDDLAVKFNVMSIPTLIVYKDGKSINRVVGGRDKEGLLELLGI